MEQVIISSNQHLRKVKVLENPIKIKIADSGHFIQAVERGNIHDNLCQEFKNKIKKEKEKVQLRMKQFLDSCKSDDDSLNKDETTDEN